MNKKMEIIKSHFLGIIGALKHGPFQRRELEDIKILAEQLVGATDEVLSRGPVSTGQDCSQNGNKDTQSGQEDTQSRNVLMPPPWCTKCGAMTDVECDCEEPDYERV